MAKLFGFSIEDSEPLSPSAVSPVPPNNEDGSDHYMSSGFFGSYVDIEGIYRTEYDLIKRYREMALQPEADSAIEDIVNEAIVSDTNVVLKEYEFIDIFPVSVGSIDVSYDSSDTIEEYTVEFAVQSIRVTGAGQAG